MLSDEPTSIRFEDSDHKNHEIEATSSEGRDITRVISRDRVVRMLSLEGRTVAMFAPSGLGRDWADAILRNVSDDAKELMGESLHFNDRENRILFVPWRVLNAERVQKWFVYF